MAARSQVDKYLEALDRLKARAEPINNDAVAIEAGSGKGSIKKSRPGYASLIAAIEQAESDRKQAIAAADPIPLLRQEIAKLRKRLDSSLEREVCLFNEVSLLQEENRQLKQGRLAIVPDVKR